jgi:iron complex transport system substrate-binding protein
MTTLLTRPDVVDDVRRREFLGILAAAGLLTACGTDGEESSPPAAATTRQVTDRTGRVVDVPVDPQRVVVLDPARASVDAVALGVVPIGGTTAASNPGGAFAPVLGPVGETMTSVGEIGLADVERIAALEPDLILFATVYQEDLSIETLSRIAPVVAYERPQFGLVEPLEFFGEVLNKQDEAERLAAEYVDVVARRREELQLEGRTVAVLNIPATVSEQAQVLGPNAGFQPVVAELGATFAPAGFEGEDFTDLSPELLAETLADVDVVIGLAFADAQEFIDAPVWQNVPAVSRGDVVYLDGQNAFGNYGLGGVEAALDDLASQLDQG